MASMFANPIRIQSAPCAPCAAKRRAGLAGLGGGNILTDLTSHLDNLWGNITGATANQRAAASAIELQTIQANAAIAEAQARSETLQKVVPWVAGGAMVLVGAVVLVKVMGKK
ncbi:MAG: hypothetical protein WC700_18270 [Gemmatimonadaceae bacterium]|jgi:hypothetical protein